MSISDVTSIWYRRPVAPDFGNEFAPEDARWLVGESLEALKGVWRTFEGFWVNRPEANEAASSKLEQLRRAERLGFHVPETLVTNEPAAVTEFAECTPLICKPLHSGRITRNGTERLFFTSKVQPSDVEALAASGMAVHLFQRCIDKAYEARVTVIGDRVFAVRLDSQLREETEVDWRRGDQSQLRHTVLELPDEVADYCLALVRSYGLEFAAIDLAYDTQGRYVFFEVNPNGQWAWLEQVTGIPLRAALADLLERGKPSESSVRQTLQT